MYSIFKKEVLNYFYSYTGPIAIGLFLLLTSVLLWLFPDSSLLESDFASLEPFFNLSPYLLILLIPAICMRSIAGEKADGTYDLLLSRPITITQIVLGKFFGAVVILLLSILPTTVYVVTIYDLASPLGNIDLGAIIGSYIGLLFLGINFTAISIFCSSMTKNSIIAYLFGSLICFLTFYAYDAISILPVFHNIEQSIKLIGIQEHYYNTSKGLLTTSDFIYFLFSTTLFLIFAISYLKFNKKKVTFYYWGISAIIYLVITQSHFLNRLGKIDFTEDSRFTLSTTSEEILNNLDKDIEITIFLDGSLPHGFSRLKNASIELLNTMKPHGKSKIRWHIINPLTGSEKEQLEFTNSLNSRGLTPTNLSVKNDGGFTQKPIYPWAIIGNGESEIAINLLQTKMGQPAQEVLNNSIQNLEYSFISAIKKLQTKNFPFIGFTEGHGEPTDLELYDAMQSLVPVGQVGRVNLDSINYSSLDQLSVLIIAKPKKAFTESDKYKIDYFVRNGGNVIWALDPININLEQISKNGSEPIIPLELNLSDQLFEYGTRINYDIVADLNCGQIPLSIGNIGGQPQIEVVPWLFHPIINPLTKHPVVKNLDGIRTEFLSTVDTVNSPGIKKEIILNTSPFSRLLNPPTEISLQMVESQPDPTKFKSEKKPVAVLLSGKFPYLYRDRLAPAGIHEPMNLNHVSKPAKMLVIGDGDWLINQVDQKDNSPFPLGWDRYTEQQFANKIFLTNIVDYFLNDESLIQLRNREVKLRLLDQSKISSNKAFWISLNIGLPLIILLLAIVIQQYYRKNKYARRN